MSEKEISKKIKDDPDETISEIVLFPPYPQTCAGIGICLRICLGSDHHLACCNDHAELFVTDSDKVSTELNYWSKIC